MDDKHLRIFPLDESKQVEFKREYTSNVLKSVSAFANYHDGTILIGVADDGSICGIDNFAALKLSIENAIHDNVSPLPYYEMLPMDAENRLILALKVMKGQNTPYYYKNKAYRRMDTSTVEVDRFELNRLILEGENSHYEDQEAKEQDLTFVHMEGLFRKALRVGSLNRDMLKSLELIKNDRYTNAAALLSDENPITTAVVHLIHYTDTKLDILDRVTLKQISLLEQFEKCMDFFQKHMTVHERIEGSERRIFEEIPVVAYREALVNAIVHRDYMINGEIRIEIFGDRLEVVSPGSLPPGISREEFIDGRLSVIRNRVVADVFYRLRYMEKLASGIRRIREYYADYEVKPEFHVSQNAVAIILPRNKSLKMERSEASLDHYDGDEAKILEYLMKHGRMTRKEVETLTGKGKTRSYQIMQKLHRERLILPVIRGRSSYYILAKVIDEYKNR